MPMSTQNITPEAQAAQATPIGKWTHDGEDVLIVRFCRKDGSNGSDHPFQYPTTVGETVTCPDWDPSEKCGGGLHGWPWGMFIGDGKNPEWDALWQVYAAKPADVANCDSGDFGKVKFRIGMLVFSGGWFGATSKVLAGQLAWVLNRTENSKDKSDVDEGAASATGVSGAASATGWSGAASATGGSGAASATGVSGAASATGGRGAASATGGRGAASATGGSSAAVVTGDDGKAKAGEYGCIALAWYNKDASRMEMRCRETGCGDGTDGKLKAHSWYRLDEAGNFVEAAE
jgi:hypothetical protein